MFLKVWLKNIVIEKDKMINEQMEELKKQWSEKVTILRDSKKQAVRMYIGYLNDLVEQYGMMHPDKKEVLLLGLELLVAKVDMPFEGSLISVRRKGFDGEQAAKIRQKERLTQSGLVRLLKSLGETGLAQSRISAYETGKLRPNEKGVYMTWLRQKGYDYDWSST